MAKYYVDVNEVNRGTFWYKDEAMKIRHRDGGPAIEWANGDKHWYIDGKLHREGGPAIEWANGDKFWYIDGNIDRLDYPAVEWANGDKEWYKNNVLHREDGPAVEFANGDVQYWLNNQRLTKEEWEAATRPPEEMTVAEIEKLLGKKIKIIK